MPDGLHNDNDLLTRNDTHESALLFDCYLPPGASSLEIGSIEEIPSSSNVGDEIVMTTEQEETEDLIMNSNQDESDSIAIDDSFDPTNTSTAKRQTRQYSAPDKLTRKRVQNPKKWKRNINKEKISRGEEYVTPKGKLIKAHALQPPCDESCRMHCSEKINEGKRQELYDYFWTKLKSKENKWLYLQGLVSQFEKSNASKDSRRKNSRKYFLPVQQDGKDIRLRVCKTMFLGTFDISDNQVATAQKKMVGSPNDKRGKNPHRPMPINVDLKKSVRDHINSLPKMPSHYVRQDSQKEYLVGSIESVAQLHEMYTQWMTENAPNVPNASYRQYNDIFNQEFNLSFFVNKKDMCDICTEYENAPEEEKLRLQESYDLHSRNKDLAQTMRLADQEVAKKPISKNLAVVSFDFEKTLICPKARESCFYYRRKLSVNNFTVVRVGKVNEELCYCYDETIARKGSNEVASFLFHFSEEKITKCGVTEFRWYCDNCWGQNKNRGVVAMMAYLVGKYKEKNIRIVLRYLEKGHSYNAADTTHSVIEAKTRRASIYTPQQWYEKIENAKRAKENKIKVIKVTQDMVVDFMELADKLNFAKDEMKSTVPISKIREVIADSEDPYKIKFKLSLDDSVSQIISLKKVGKPVNFETYKLQPVYTTGALPITKLKMNDLSYYCDKHLIPVEHQEFFRNLPSAEGGEDNHDDETIVMPQPQRGRPRKRRVRQGASRSDKRAHNENDEDEEDDPEYFPGL